MPGINNWYKLNLNQYQDNSLVKFEPTFDKIKFENLSFQAACDYTAQLIAEKYSNIHLCLSGGMDSEHVANVLVRNKIEFTPVIVRINKWSEFEAWYAWHWCQTNKKTPLVLDYRTKHTDLAKSILSHSLKIRCDGSAGFLPCVVADNIDGSVLTGYGESAPVVSEYAEDLGSVLEIEQHDFYIDISMPEKHPGGFFSYTPEVFYSSVSELDMLLNTQSAKEKLYNVPFRPKMQWGSVQLNVSEQLKQLLKMYTKPRDLMCFKPTKENLLNNFL